MGQCLSYGMVGGGEGAFIGEVHRAAIRLDGLARLDAACFSRKIDVSRATGSRLGIDSRRIYASFEEMAEREAEREDGIDFVVVAAPNYLHYAASRAFLERGIHVVCEKPLCFEPSEAEELVALSAKRDLLFCVNYTYSGYPAVKEIREQIRTGAIGDIRFVNAEYASDWLASVGVEASNPHAAWRMDGATSGKSNCVGDIGSHIEHLVAYTTGLRVTSLCARLDRLVAGRELDDNASILVEYSGGAKGLYWSSQVAAGSDNGLRLRVFGSKGGIEWRQEDPNYFRLDILGQPSQTWSRGRDAFHPYARSLSRLPAGHPEGYLEAEANILRNFARSLAARTSGKEPSPDDLDFPGAREGLDGVRFIDACVESSRRGVVWISY